MVSLDIPDISGTEDKFDFKVRGVRQSDFSVARAPSKLSAGNHLALDLSGIHVAALADWSFKADFWPHVPHVSGSVDVTIGSVSYIEGDLAIALLNDRPQFDLRSSSVHLDGLKIHAYGSKLR